jgi:hypothetical protein
MSGQVKRAGKGATMISDVLHEAIAEIERGQRSFPKSYHGLRVEIGKATAVMNALQTWLGCPPSKGRYPRYEEALGQLRAELASLDVEPLLRALDGLKASWPTPEEVEEANRESGPAPSKHQEQNEAADGQPH